MITMEVSTAAVTVTVTIMASATGLSTAPATAPRMLTTKATQRLSPMVARILLLTGEHLCSARVRHWMQAPTWGCTLARASKLGSLLLFRARGGESSLADACRSSCDFCLLVAASTVRTLISVGMNPISAVISKALPV